MSNSRSSPRHYHQHTSVYRRNPTITTRRRPLTSVDHPYVSRYQATITPQNYQPVAHVSSRDLAERLLRQIEYYFQETSELIVDEYTYMEEKQDNDILLEYFKTRTHLVDASKDGLNNTIQHEEICAICQAEFEHEESIRTLGCGHECHISCIKQWLLRKKDCPICRAPVSRMHNT